jgi:hypothetical protein
MGLKFTMLRFMLNLPVIILIALITEKALSTEEKQAIYDKCRKNELKGARNFSINLTNIFKIKSYFNFVSS